MIRGWVEYYKLARMKKTLETIDAWLRRRIRMCIWKSWKNPKTRIANLIKCGLPKKQAWKQGWTHGYWHVADTWRLVSRRLSLLNGLLRVDIVNEEPPYAEPHVRWCERSENESRRKTTSFSSYSIIHPLPSLVQTHYFLLPSST